MQVFLLLEGLRSRGHHNVLICPPGSRCEAEARQRRMDVRSVPMRNYLDLAALFRLRGELRAADADVVHLHTGRAIWLGGLAARLAGLPAITTRRMDRAVRRGWRTRLIYGSLVQRAVAISPAVAARLREGGVPAALVRTICSAVDPRSLEPSRRPQATRGAEGLAQDEQLLLCLASLVPRKGVDVLLRALARLAERPALWIAGDGPERSGLEKLSQQLGVASRVRFLGARSDAADLLAACDVFVLPSRLEGLGVAALEAMAAGRPVVASKVGGLAESVIEGRTGLLVPPDDPVALAGALQRLLEDGELRRELGAAGPDRVAEGFLPEQMVEAYESLYAEVVRPSPEPRPSTNGAPLRLIRSHGQTPASLTRLIDAHERALRSGRDVLKDRRATAVTRVQSDGLDLCVKQYHRRGLGKRIVDRLRPLPALRAWNAAAHLSSRGVPTPQPVAVFQRGAATYLVTRFVADATSLDRLLPELATDDRRRLLRAAGSWLHHVHALSIYHDDTSAKNVLASEGADGWSFQLTDLDGLDPGNRLTHRRRVKNLAQFVDPELGRTWTDGLRLLRGYADGDTALEWRKLVREVAAAARRRREDRERTMERNRRRAERAR